jgi:hypothetical protein
MWIEFIWLKTETKADSCEHGNEALGFIKGKEFLDCLNDCCLLQEGLCSMELKMFPIHTSFTWTYGATC